MKPAIAGPAGLAVALTVALVVAGDSLPVRVLADLAVLGLSTCAAMSATVAARFAEGRVRTAWTVMSVALVAWALGDAVRILDELVLHDRPSPPPPDFFYLSFAVLAAIALPYFPPEPTSRSRFRAVLDGATVALCSFLLAWILALHRVVDTYRDDRQSLILAVLYPLADVAALAIAVTVLARAGARHRAVLSLLTVGIGLSTITDIVYVYFLAEGRHDAIGLSPIGWAAALVAFIAAAHRSGSTRTLVLPAVSVPSNSSLWLPYVPLFLAGTIGPAVVMSGLERVVVPLVIVAVCLRQVVAAWENRRLVSAVAEQALRDPLTGVGNETLFDDRLTHAMTLRERHGVPVAVATIDLDDFRLINDSLGHPVADSLLVHVGRRISDRLRRGDTIARVGGDEFSLLLEGDVADSYLVIQRVVDAFNDPFVIEGHDVVVRPSVGVALASPTERDLTPEALRERADIATHAAKQSRASRVHTFSDETLVAGPDIVEMAGREPRSASGGAAQVRLLAELRTAIDTSGLDVVYQPKVELRTRRIVGVETLLRWQHPELGLLRPDAFMSLVRQHGLMRAVTDLVLEKALGDAARWRAAGAEIPVAVNMFAPFLRDTDLPDALCEALRHRGLPAALLTVEITEDVVLTDLSVVTEVLGALRGHGIHVAIDDFGSGYSALSYLPDLPFDEVKLDRQFIASVTTDARAAAVVRAVIELGHDLGATVVAEGIEDGLTASWLRHHGCDVGQGFYFGKPVGADEVLRMVKVAEPT